MNGFLRVLRYIVFGLFIICNAVIASVAVWNQSLAQSIGWTPRIDIYLAFLGCFGLAHIFTIIFIELAYRHAITGRVWFECLWVGLFWVLYLAGASALTSISPIHMCQSQVRLIINDACLSTRLLLGFTWSMTGTLLSYFFLLLIASLVHLKHDSRIFHCYVHKFPWGGTRRPPPSAPMSPSFFKAKKTLSIVAPKPQRPAPTALYAHHAGLQSNYEIESYPTPVLASSPALPMPMSIIYNSKDIPQSQDFNTAPSFYPQFIQSVLRTEPVALEPVCATTQSQLRSPRQVSDSQPLGDWPRTNAVILPPTRSRVRPGHTIPMTSTLQTSQARFAPNALFLPRPRPTGPRRRSDGEGRVVVSNINSHR